VNTLEVIHQPLGFPSERWGQWKGQNVTDDVSGWLHKSVSPDVIQYGPALAGQCTWYAHSV
jgi:hypothetical protein